MQLSQSRHLLFGFVVLGLEVNSGPSNADQKPTGAEIALVAVKCAQNRHQHESSLSQFPR